MVGLSRGRPGGGPPVGSVGRRSSRRLRPDDRVGSFGQAGLSDVLLRRLVLVAGDGVLGTRRLPSTAAVRGGGGAVRIEPVHGGAAGRSSPGGLAGAPPPASRPGRWSGSSGGGSGGRGTALLGGDSIRPAGRADFRSGCARQLGRARCGPSHDGGLASVVQSDGILRVLAAGGRRAVGGDRPAWAAQSGARLVPVAALRGDRPLLLPSGRRGQRPVSVQRISRRRDPFRVGGSDVGRTWRSLPGGHSAEVGGLPSAVVAGSPGELELRPGTPSSRHAYVGIPMGW